MKCNFNSPAFTHTLLTLFLGYASSAAELNLFERFSTLAGTSAVTITNQVGATLPYTWNVNDADALSRSGFAIVARSSALVWKIFNDRPHDNDVAHARSSNEAFAVLPPSGVGNYARVTFSLAQLPPLPTGHVWVLKANVGLAARATRSSIPSAYVDIDLANQSGFRKVRSLKVVDTVIPIFSVLNLNAVPLDEKLVFTVSAIDPSQRERVVFDALTLEAMPILPLLSSLGPATGTRISSENSATLGPAPFGIPSLGPWPHGYYAAIESQSSFGGMHSSSPALSLAPPSIVGEELLLRFPLNSLQREASHTVVARLGLEDKLTCRFSNTRVRISFFAEGRETLTQLNPSQQKYIEDRLRDVEIGRGRAQVFSVPLGILNRLSGSRLAIRVKLINGTAPCTNVIIDGLSVVASGAAKRLGVQWLPNYADWENPSHPGHDRLKLMSNLFGIVPSPATPQSPYNAKGGTIRMLAREASLAPATAKAIAEMKGMNFRVNLHFNPLKEDFDLDANGFYPFNPQNDYFTGEHLFKLTQFEAPHCVHKITGVHFPKASAVPCPTDTERKAVECLNSFDRAQRLPFAVFPTKGACGIQFVGVPDPDSHTDLSRAQSGSCQNLAGIVDAQAVYIPPCRNPNHLPDHANNKCMVRDPSHPNQWIIATNATYEEPSCESRFMSNANYPRRVPGLSKINPTKFQHRIATYLSAIQAETSRAIDFIEIGNELNSAAYNDDFDISRPFNDVLDSSALGGTVIKYREILTRMRRLKQSVAYSSVLSGTQILLGGSAYYNRLNYQSPADDDREQRQGGKVPGWLFVEKIRVESDANGNVRDRLTPLVDGVALHVYPAPGQMVMAKEMVTKVAAVVGKKMPLWISETGQHLMRFDIPNPSLVDGVSIHAGPGYAPANAIDLKLRPYFLFRTLQTLLANPYGDVQGAVIADMDHCHKFGLLSAWHDISSGECVMPSEAFPSAVPYLPEARVLGVYGP